MIQRTVLAAVAAAMLFVGSAAAGDAPGAPTSPPPPAASPKTPAGDVGSPRGISFTRDVKEAWAQAREDGRRAGRAIGDGARSFGRATRDATVDAWHKVKKAFSS